MKNIIALLIVTVAFASKGDAATIAWSAGIDNGFSNALGNELQQGSLIRLGHFRNPITLAQLSDTEIQILAANPSALNSSFVEAASSTIGNGFGVNGHFSSSNSPNTGASGLNLAGQQIYIWVFNAPTLAAATEQGIFYFDKDSAVNPDNTPVAPGARWKFPVQDPVPGDTTIDLSDFTVGATTRSDPSAHIVVGAFPRGTSSATSAPNFGLAFIPEPSAVALLGCGLGALFARRRRLHV